MFGRLKLGMLIVGAEVCPAAADGFLKLKGEDVLEPKEEEDVLWALASVSPVAITVILA